MAIQIPGSDRGRQIAAESAQADEGDLAVTQAPTLAATTGAAAPAGRGLSPATTAPTVVEATGMHSPESERLVLAAALSTQREGIQHSLLAMLGHDDFFVDTHQTIWRLIGWMREAGIVPDPVSLVDAAATQQEFIGGAPYIMELMQDPVARTCSDESVSAAANRIKGFSMTRRCQRTLEQAMRLCATGQAFEHISTFVEDDFANLKRLTKSSDTGPRQAGYFYDALLSRIESHLNGEQVEVGVSTGFEQLDAVLGGGLPRGEGLIVIAGRPAMGKTAFAVAIEQLLSTRGVPTLIFSLEMSGLSIAQRALARHARIPLKHIKSASIAEHDFSSMCDSIDVLSRAPCYIDETPGLTIAEIRARARKFIEAHPNGAIFVDYMQKVAGRPNGPTDPNRIVAETSAGLTLLQKELKCPLIVLSQLNRGVEQRANKRPMMADLKESGQIEQDAAVIMFLYRDEYYNPDSTERGMTEVILGKNRDGELCTVKFASDLSRMLYVEVGQFQSEE